MEKKEIEDFELTNIPKNSKIGKIIKRLLDEGLELLKIDSDDDKLTIEAVKNEALEDFLSRSYFRIFKGHKVTIIRTIRRKDQKIEKIDPSKIFAENQAPSTNETVLIQFVDIPKNLQDYKLLASEFFQKFPYWSPWTRVFSTDGSAIVQIPYSRLEEYQKNFFGVKAGNISNNGNIILPYKMMPWRKMIIMIKDPIQFIYLKNKDDFLKSLTAYSFNLNEVNGKHYIEMNYRGIADESMISVYSKIERLIQDLCIKEMDGRGLSPFLKEYFDEIWKKENFEWNIIVNTKINISKIIICSHKSIISSAESIVKNVINTVQTYTIEIPRNISLKSSEIIISLKKELDGIPFATSSSDKKLILGSNSQYLEMIVQLALTKFGIKMSNCIYLNLTKIQISYFMDFVLPNLKISEKIILDSSNPISIKGPEHARSKLYYEINKRINLLFFQSISLPKIMIPLLKNHLKTLFGGFQTRFEIYTKKEFDFNRKNSTLENKTIELNVCELSLNFEEIILEFCFDSDETRKSIETKLCQLSIKKFSSKKEVELQNYTNGNITTIRTIELENNQVKNQIHFLSFESLELIKLIEKHVSNNQNSKETEIFKKEFITIENEKNSLFNYHQRQYELEFIKKFQPRNNSLLEKNSFIIESPWKEILLSLNYYNSFEFEGINDENVIQIKFLNSRLIPSWRF